MSHMKDLFKNMNKLEYFDKETSNTAKDSVMKAIQL